MHESMHIESHVKFYGDTIKLLGVFVLIEPSPKPQLAS